jgi:H+/Cl- antiporter ClcA
VGREGPTIQLSASIFHWVGNKTEKFFKHRLEPELWLVTGTGAGIAAAFNTPLGGLVYAIEEFTTAHLNKFRSSLISAVIISGMASQWFAGPYLYLGYPKLTHIGYNVLPWALLIGGFTGWAGAWFGESLYLIHLERAKFPKKRSFAYFAMLCGLLVPALGIVLGKHVLGPGREMIIDLLFDKNCASNWQLMIGRFLTPIFSYVCGSAGGIFAPSLAAGGAIGAFIANIVHSNNSHLFILLGMIGFLTGVTRVPFTSFVLVLEMTDRHSAIFSMMVAALTAYSFSRIVSSKSFYEHMKIQYLHQATMAKKDLKEKLL